MTISIDGRPVVSRADLHQQHGYAISTLERWWADREANGHPPVAHTIGNTMYWDQQTWEAWNRTRTGEDLEGWVTRPELAQATDLAIPTLEKLWADREANGHPEARTIGGTLRWPLKDWKRWHTRYQKTRPKPVRGRAAAVRAVKPTDPNELVGPAGAARILGHKDTTTVSHNIKNPPPGWPEPDDWDELPSGRRRPKWQAARIAAYAKTRSTTSGAGAGRRAGTRNGTAYQGDPRLDHARRALAAHPDAPTGDLVQQLLQQHPDSGSPAAWRRILAAARTQEEA